MKRIQSKTGESISLKLLDDSDISLLENFNKNLSEKTRAQFLPHKYNEETIRQYIERNKKGFDRIYVAYFQDEIIGYFFLWDFNKKCPVLGIGIADAFQGKGLGKQMMTILIEDAKTTGKEGVLLTTVLANDVAFQLYKKVGFQYICDTDNVAGDGRVVKERVMFFPLVENAKPDIPNFKPPVL